MISLRLSSSATSSAVQPELYETAFALFEEAQMTGQGDASVAQTFHETFNGLYTEFLDTLFEEMLSNRKD